MTILPARLRFFTIGIFLACLVFGVGMIEVVIRVLQPYRLHLVQENEEFSRFDPELGWTNRPGASGRFVRRDFDVPVEINERGMRDRIYSYVKPKKTLRIAVLGDSFTWGYGVLAEERFTDRLERILSGSEVLNFGTSGYGQDQELILMLRDVHRYSPDWVLVALHPRSDFLNNTQSYQDHREKPLFYMDQGRLQLTNVPVPRVDLGRRWNAAFARRFALWSFIMERKWNGVMLVNSFIGFADRYQRGGELNVRVPHTPPEAMTCTLLEEIRSRATAWGAKTAVLWIPDIEAGREEIKMTAGYAALRACLKKKEIPVVDPSGAFREFFDKNTGKDLTFAHDSHWNAEGHALAAEQLAGFFRSLEN